MILKNASKIKRIILRQAEKKSNQSWQSDKNNSYDKTALILPEIDRLSCKSVLDIGCNAGAVTRLLGRNVFAVGIDQNIDLRGYEHPLKGACLGEVQISEHNVKKIPEFDAVCLLSVHHQWHFYKGDGAAEEMVKAISKIACKVLFVEFAAINSKYTDNPGIKKFEDNNEDSIREYAENWLSKVVPQHVVSYLGKTTESTHEPYRYMFSCARI